MSAYQPRGLYFQEFTLGREMVSPGRTVTEADIVAFAGLSGDYNPLHTDAEFARTTAYQQRIAHGLLGLSIASGLADRVGFIDGTAMAFLGLSWKFKAPILIGDTVHLRAKVAKTRPVRSMGGGMVIFDVSVLNQREEVVQTGEWTLLVKAREE